jgi:glutamyl-tRNA synthetase
MDASGKPTTRLAPSPTGALHLGNARTFLVNWLLARQRGWRIILRVEDLDGPRIKRGADVQAIEDLRWLGIDWDGQPLHQSQRLAHYRAAVERLLARGLAYPCTCSRREVDLAASAPHAEDGAAIYPGTCRGRWTSVEEAQRAAGRRPALRFAVQSEQEKGGHSCLIRRSVPLFPLEFADEFAGRHTFDAASQLGDFVIAKADGTPAYQLAVVVDDAAMGITHVVRGDDLLDSTPRQMLLYRALGLERAIPSYCHLPLVVGQDGRRLAKRHGDTRLSSYRAAGISAGRVLSLLGRWCGVEAPEPRCAADLLERFDLARVPRQPIVFTADDERFLRAG